jgi:hypothetical protein
MTDKKQSNDFNPAGNAEKNPDDWVTGDEAMTGPQASYLQTLAREAGEEFDPGTHQGGSVEKN